MDSGTVGVGSLDPERKLQRMRMFLWAIKYTSALLHTVKYMGCMKRWRYIHPYPCVYKGMGGYTSNASGRK